MFDIYQLLLIAVNKKRVSLRLRRHTILSVSFLNLQ